MLSHVVRDWLARVRKERDLDNALMAYLGATGFWDVHFTHGPGEIGKDFIGKKQVPAGPTQYALQSKAGNITTVDWRGIREQMWEAVRVGLPHPSFDPALPRQGVLVLTGDLVGGAQLQVDEFNEQLKRDSLLPIEVWHNEELVRRFSTIDPATVYPANRRGYEGYGKFFALYGAALGSDATPRHIERHTRLWLADEYSRDRLVLPAVESSVIASAAESAKDHYAAFHARLGLVRMALEAAFLATGKLDQDFYDECVHRALPLCQYEVGPVSGTYLLRA